MLGKYTVNKLVDGAFQRVNFDKQRTLVLNDFLQNHVSSDDYKAATPPGNQRPQQAVPKVPDVQRAMGVYALKTICAVASTLKEQLGEDEVPLWTDLAYLTVDPNQSECTKNWTQAITTYLQSSLRPKTHSELNTPIVVTPEELMARQAQMAKWMEEKAQKLEDVNKSKIRVEESRRNNEVR